MRKLALSALLLAILGGAFVKLVPARVEARMNRVLQQPPYAISPEAKKLFEGSVDLHADPLLWGRDLLQRGTRGQTDIPRLLEAGAGLQVFGVVTQAPSGQNISHNADDARDQVTLLAVASAWPVRTWRSKLQRALYQADRLHDFAARSQGKLVPVLSKADLAALGPGRLGALLALEGSQALEGDLANVDKLYDKGFRMMAPTHFLDTEIAGSAHGARKQGLTPLGVQWLQKLEARKIIVDLAHASPQTVDEVLARATRPVVVSHTGVKGTCDNERNLSDAHLKALAANGALVGIGDWETATCGTDARAIARAMRHAADVMGVEHVALGSDFDGSVVTPFDATGVPLLADALRAEKFTDAEIRAIASGNALRFFAENLP